MFAQLPLLQRMVRNWHKLLALASDPYRPELHYMRGPGPKWHAKHGLEGLVLTGKA